MGLGQAPFDRCLCLVSGALGEAAELEGSGTGIRELLLNWFRAKGQLSSGVVEGFNGKAKLTSRKAFGFRTCHGAEIALYHALARYPSLNSPTDFADEPGFLHGLSLAFRETLNNRRCQPVAPRNSGIRRITGSPISRCSHKVATSFLARDVQDAQVPRRPWMAGSGPGEIPSPCSRSVASRRRRTPDRLVRSRAACCILLKNIAFMTTPVDQLSVRCTTMHILCRKFVGTKHS